jgi:hypothetical protein
VGAIWCLVGVVYVVLKTRAIGEPVVIDFTET